MKELHCVKTFNLSGKFIHEDTFSTAEAAYEEYCDTVQNLKDHLPKGYGTTVVRYNGGHVMAMETIIGTK